MNKNRLLLIVTFLMLSLLVAACGGGAAEPTEAPVEAPTEAPAEEPTEEPMEEPTEAPMEEEDEEMAEANSIVDIAVEDGRFTTLVAAVQAAGLAETLSGDGAFTVFAPTDDAFAALPEGTVESLLEEPEGALKDILLYHVAEGVVPAETVVTLESATTIQGEPVTIEVVDGEVILNGSAKVVITDIEASNGIIHVIDAVLLPPSIAAAPAEEEMDSELMVMTAENCDYGGLFKEIAAIDELTVQFTMCASDPAFPPKAAFSAFGIQPSEHLEMTGGSPLDNPVGTGAYMLDTWNRGDSIIMQRFDDYWGEPAAADTLVFRWSTEGAARLLELQSGQVDGIDNPSPDDFETISADSNLQLIERPALNIFYVGMNNWFEPFDNEMVRQAVAQCIDRDRIVDTFYPAGSEVASHFTPCSIPNACVGDSWYEFNPAAAQDLLTEAGFPDGFSTSIAYRDVVRSYLPEVSLVAQDLQAQLLENCNIDAEIEVMESGAFIQAADAGELEGLHLLGWGADYPDQTNFLDFHFGAGASDQFGDKFDDITAALISGAALADNDAREPFYVEANNLIKQHVPMVPIAHGGSATAYQADVDGAHSSPLGNEYFAAMDPGGRDTFVWMQNAEPISLYCGDETDGESLRACEQVVESLLAYEIGGTAVQPSLATSCDPNEDLTVWTCNLREGVVFHDGSTLDANDVVVSYGLQWDAADPLHVGNSGAFTYFSALWGGLMNAEE